MHNVTSVCGGKSSPYDRRFGEPFTGNFYQFGFKVFYKLMLDDANAKVRKFERKATEGVLVGCVVQPGGKWAKDYLVLDLETATKNYGSRYIKSRRTGDGWWKSGQAVPKSRHSDRVLSRKEQISIGILRHVWFVRPYSVPRKRPPEKF